MVLFYHNNYYLGFSQQKAYWFLVSLFLYSIFCNFLKRKGYLFLNYFFKWAKLAKFIRYEALWKLYIFYHKVLGDGVKWLRFWAHWGTSEMFWMRDEGWGVKSWSWWIVKGCEMQDGVYAYRKEPFPLWRDSSLCCASFRMRRLCFLLTIRNLNYFWNAKIFYYSNVFNPNHAVEIFWDKSMG